MSMKAGTSGCRGPRVRAIDGAEVRGGDGLRRHVAGMPVILVARVEDEAEVAGLEGLDERAVVHDLGDVGHPFGDLQSVHAGGDGLEGGVDGLGFHALLEGRVLLHVPDFGGRLSAGHPEDDDRIGGGLELRRLVGAEMRAEQGGGRCGGAGAEEVAAGGDIRIHGHIFLISAPNTGFQLRLGKAMICSIASSLSPRTRSSTKSRAASQSS